MGLILEEVAKLLFWLIVELVLVGTGEVIRFIVSFGRHRPRWSHYTRESPTKFVILTEVSFWIGAAFWVAVIALVYRLVSGT